MSKLSLSVKLRSSVLQNLKNRIADSASLMPDLNGKNIVMGFWHNWPPGYADGYKQGHFKEMELTDIPEQYNVVAVAFMKGHGIPTFKPYKHTDAEFRRQVGELNAQGRAVLISLGGADAEIGLTAGQEDALAYEIIRLVETYGFDGLDIDLEQSAITAMDNSTVLPAALRLVKDHYRQEGKNFIISMAPEFPYLRESGNYEAYIDNLEDYYDFIAPQFYNQGNDGVWVDEINTWLTQNNDELKKEFLYYLTDSIVNGTRGYLKVPNDKFVIGLPANNDAAATGYVINPQDALDALDWLAREGQPIRGLMTWSVNWDDGTDKNGAPYNWEFIKSYGHISGEGAVPERPASPGGLASDAQTETSILLHWNAASGPEPISYYTVYRNGQAIPGNITSTSFTDSGLTSSTTYRYQVSATDTKGRTSALSTPVSVSTRPGETPINEWATGVRYLVGNQVTYQGKKYQCEAIHSSRKEWTPVAAVTLWSALQVRRS